MNSGPIHVMCTTHSYPVRGQLQIPQLRQSLQAFDLRDLVLDKVYVPQLLEVVHPLNRLDLVKTQVEAREIGQLLQPLDMGYEIIVEVEVSQGRAECGKAVDVVYGILTEA